jgi:hypothetical protein
MKIPLNINRDGIITVSGSIRSERYRLYKPIVMMIDTGSPETFMSEEDAIKYRIPIDSLEFSKPAYGLGGGTFNLHKLTGVTLSFLDESKNIIRVMLQSMQVSLSLRKDERSRFISKTTPSIIGTDFLKNNGFAFYLDMAGNVAYLEKKSSI